KVQALQARCKDRPACLELGSERRKLRPASVQGYEILAGEWVELAGGEVQPCAAWRIGPPGGPGGEKVEPEAKARLEDDEALAPLPALWQVVPGKKDVLYLPECAVGGVIDVLEGFGPGRAVIGEGEPGWKERHQVRGAERVAWRLAQC